MKHLELAFLKELTMHSVHWSFGPRNNSLTQILHNTLTMALDKQSVKSVRVMRQSMTYRGIEEANELYPSLQEMFP